MVADFASEYGIRLFVVRDSMSWQEFSFLVRGLMGRRGTRLAECFATDDEGI